MDKVRDLRTSLAAKCGAIALLIAVCAAAAVGSFAVVLLSCGYGAGSSFQEDLLCREQMESALGDAFWYVVESGGSSYFSYRSSLERCGGFSAQVYQGNPADGNLAGSWGDVPKGADLWFSEADTRSWDGTEYTVVGYLSHHLPAGSNFAVRFSLYNQLRSLSFGVTVLLTVILWCGALALLVFLLCAAGHKAGREGVVLNWQDRIPLDLYLCCTMTLLTIGASVGMSSSGLPMALEAASCALGLLVAGAAALATLLTLATRLKKGKILRNTICWRLWRWCVMVCRAMWDAMMEFLRVLPLTWRGVLFTGSVLAVQTFLTLVVFDSYSNNGWFFLLMLILDAALVAAAAWLTIQLQKVLDMGSALAAGELDAHLDTEKMYFDVKRHAKHLNAIGEGMNKAVEQRMKSERLKTELITNVSHDIKTPLTSIVNYVDLLKKEELPPAAGEYLAVLDRQSKRLKKLTEDLVEASKASTGSMTVNMEPIVVNEIIHQAIGDYDEKLAAGRLEVIVSTFEGNLMALADGRLLWRVLDNLLSNVCKYALGGTRVYVDLSAHDGRVFLSMKNISRDPLNISADELMERFVRGDASRHTEGSGLGLNIARSLMDLMDGTFQLSVDGDLFKAELSLKG
ncbi:MAG: HAMP domain-containing histidine kinase [Oscillospiraceae bacterium]|nr:HAMP domain-containing histidine kinase [Oscillospiraceae bacterium]